MEGFSADLGAGEGVEGGDGGMISLDVPVEIGV